MNFMRFSGELNTSYVKDALKTNLSLLGILFGFIVISVATGQFSNYDSQLEYTAALGVVKWGLPYIEFGKFINQPPLGFYSGALFLRCLGSSYAVAVTGATLFGVGCIFLVYEIGRVLYGKQTGLFAAAIFALTTWHVVLSRSFLIDVQCLFFSLFYLLVGILAVKKYSTKLFLLSGVLFGVAFLTKAFAVFMLIPLVLFYYYSRPKNVRRTFRWLEFFVPVLIFIFLWYEIISGRGFIDIFTHDDFQRTLNVVAPSYFFVVNYLLGTLGVFFLAACAISLLISFVRRKTLGNILAFDLICLATVAVVAGVNMFLAIGLDLLCPYNNPIKYEYQFLPLFCLFAASLLNKCHSLCCSTNLRGKRDKLIFLGVLFGLSLLAISMVQNVQVLNSYATQKVIQFRVEREICYLFDNVALKRGTNTSLAFQWVGFAIVVSSLLWATRNRLKMLGAPPR